MRLPRCAFATDIGIYFASQFNLYGATLRWSSHRRTEAKRRFTVEDHKRMTEGVECRKDAEVIDETPAAYKPIESVMAAQQDLVEIVHTLHQVVCVKG